MKLNELENGINGLIKRCNDSDDEIKRLRKVLAEVVDLCERSDRYNPEAWLFVRIKQAASCKPPAERQ